MQRGRNVYFPFLLWLAIVKLGGTVLDGPQTTPCSINSLQHSLK